MSPSLPMYMVLRSKENLEYLGYFKGEAEFVNGRISFTTNQVVSPYAKLEVKKAKTGNGLVHIRCCYNNKFWVLDNEYPTLKCIKAAANEPDEDKSKSTCTLFEPVYVSDFFPDQGLRFRHAQTGNFIRAWKQTARTPPFLNAETSDPDTSNLSDAYTVVDWGSLLVLPQHVAFKGDNGKYLRAVNFRDDSFLQFSSDDVGDPDVLHEVVTNRDGSVRIKNNKFGKFWRRSPNWIWADSDLDYDSRENKDMMFWPVKLDGKVVALKNLGNNWFCKRLTDYWEDCLNAATPTITEKRGWSSKRLSFL